ncbi:MAG: membrane protein insertion efficiency factor YidD [Desulfobacteraceae bacterium]|nr:MAG: membrane protein insertion efficiency factor YidD [Desulfobacteraceae bacterium]
MAGRLIRSQVTDFYGIQLQGSEAHVMKISIFLILFLFAGLFAAAPLSWADPLPADGTQENSLWGSPIRIFQKFVSRADGNRCPMYPSCSHYSAEAFAEKGIIKGAVLTCDRLLRCGRDETRLAESIHVQGVRHTFDPLTANTFWWDRR